MERLFKLVFITFLLLISLSASIFMIIESGSFFQTLYKSRELVSFMGYWAAFLNEVFMAVMAAVWIPGKKCKNRERSHPINFLFKMLLVFLFITTVCGSSLNTVYPLIDSLQEQANKQKIIEILQSQIRDNQLSLNTFISQNQKVNAALTVRNQIKVKEELKNLTQGQRSLFSYWLEIATILFLRFGVQLSNLSCIWLAGWLYRRPNEVASKTSSDSKPITQHPTKPAPKLKKPALFPRNGVSQSFPPTVQQPLPTKSVGIQERPKPLATASLANTKPSKSSELSPPANRNRKTGSPLVKPSKTDESSNVKWQKTESVENELVSSLRNRIVQLIRSRNEGISLSQIGGAIGETESSLREILNPRSEISNGAVPVLEGILAKIEKLYLEEQTRSY